MSDIFDFVSDDVQPRAALRIDESPNEAVTAPMWIMVILLGELLVSAILLLPESKPFHVVGYVIAAVGVSLTVIVFRSVDRTRRRSPSYVNHSWPQLVAVVALISGLLIAAAHAYFFAQNKQVAA